MNRLCCILLNTNRYLAASAVGRSACRVFLCVIKCADVLSRSGPLFEFPFAWVLHLFIFLNYLQSLTEGTFLVTVCEFEPKQLSRTTEFLHIVEFLFFIFIHFINRLKTQLLIRCLVRLVAKGNEKPQAFAPFDTTIWIHDERIRYLAIRFDLVRFLPLISDSLCSESGVDLPLTGKWRRRRRAGSLFIKYVFINQNDPFNTPPFFP